MAHFGERLRWAREHAGLSQERLGLLIDASRQQVYSLEKKESAPNGETVKRFAVALGITSDFLLGLSDNPQMAEADGLTPSERVVLSLLRNGEKMEAIKVIAGG